MEKEGKKFFCALCNELAFEIFYRKNPNSEKHELVIQDASAFETNYVTLRDKSELYEILAECSIPELFNEYIIEKHKKKEAWFPGGLGLSLYCSLCKRIYCEKHYRTDVFESETRYRCPNGHEKTIRD
ncbi:MAG: hypothetical protein ACP5N9_01750 [Candidatus Bilamarchaeum sp.]|jgi:hypothetical protein